MLRKIHGYIDGLDDPGDILQTLFNVANEPWFLQDAEAAAMRMVTHLFTDSGRTWREAARKNGKGLLLYQALMKEMQGPLGIVLNEHIQRNADFITQIPEAIAREMTQKIMELQMQGLRSSDIVDEIKKLYPHMSDVKANLIARTEAAKTSSNLVQSRSQILGIEWYKWQTSEDGRVRDSHRHMDQVLVNWNDPPSPEALSHELHIYGHYHAGNIWNCRCYPEPVIDTDFIEWPAKMYANGSIFRVTKHEFEELIGLPMRREAAATRAV